MNKVNDSEMLVKREMLARTFKLHMDTHCDSKGNQESTISEGERGVLTSPSEKDD